VYVFSLIDQATVKCVWDRHDAKSLGFLTFSWENVLTRVPSWKLGNQISLNCF